MKKYRIAVNLFLLLMITINGLITSKYTAFMFLCTIFATANMYGEVLDLKQKNQQ